MTTEQRRFWEEVRDFARARRCARRVALDVAADALALEQEIEERLAGDAGGMQAVAEPSNPEAR